MSKKSNGEPPKTLFSRSKELLKIVAKVGGQDLSHKLSSLVSEHPTLKKLNLQMEQAQALVEGLTHLRGAAMKAGQMLSLEARDFLPPEVIEILNQLHDKSESMPFSKVEEILIANLGRELYGEIQGLTQVPVASASIGQVHRAKFRNQDVAIKVQFPGVAQSIGTDLFMLKKISETFIALSGKSINLESLFKELTVLLKQEVDYINEATQMEEYSQILSKHKDFVVPRPIPKLVNSTVLGMSFEEGIKPDVWLSLNPSMAEREHYAKLILDLYVIEFFKNGFVQTDPNFGNFLIRPEQKQLVLLDFGCMKRYSQAFIKEYKKLLIKIREGHAPAIIQHCQEMGLIDPRESQECCDAFIKMLQMSLEPFSKDNQAFDFSQTSYSADIRKASLDFTKLIRFSPPPHQILFLHRKLSGIFRMLQSLKVKIPLQEYWENFVSV